MDKVAIVTGGARGIGKAIAQKLKDDGFLLAIFDLLESGNDDGIYFQGNITNKDDRDRFIETVMNKYGRIDLLVNNAGVAPRVRANILEMTEESYDFVMGINLKAPFFLTQAVAKKMMGNNGIVINISSMSAYTSSISRAEYCLSKAGVSMATTLYADALAEFGINVYEIRPGIIKTDMTEAVTEKYDKLIFEDNILPIKRWGQAVDIANAVSVLASGALSYSTGEIINVDGGFHIRRI